MVFYLQYFISKWIFVKTSNLLQIIVTNWRWQNSLNFLYNVYIKLGYSSFSMEDILGTLSDGIGNFSIQRRFQCYWMSKYYLSWISYETLCFVWEIVDSVWIREVTVELKDKCKTFSDNFPKELWITACCATASKIRIFTDIFLVIYFMRFNWN